MPLILNFQNLSEETFPKMYNFTPPPPPPPPIYGTKIAHSIFFNIPP